MKTATSLLAIVLCIACGGAPDATSDGAEGSSQQALSNKDFDVDFADCAETDLIVAGVGAIARGRASPVN